MGCSSPRSISTAQLHAFLPKTLTITADDKDIKFTFNIPQNAVPVGNAGDRSLDYYRDVTFALSNVYANQYSTTPLSDIHSKVKILAFEENQYIMLSITEGYGAGNSYFIQPNALYNDSPNVTYRYPVYSHPNDIGDPTEVVFWIELE